MENLGYALLLMLVGMTTVFLILMIVIGLGKSLILLVNRYGEEQPSLPATAPSSPAPTSLSDIPEQIVVAIVSSVSIVTDGKGKVTSIRK
jgi:oxaloacetate decarboxylase gamma subunit